MCESVESLVFFEPLLHSSCGFSSSLSLSSFFVFPLCSPVFLINFFASLLSPLSPLFSSFPLLLSTHIPTTHLVPNPRPLRVRCHCRCYHRRCWYCCCCYCRYCCYYCYCENEKRPNSLYSACANREELQEHVRDLRAHVEWERGLRAHTVCEYVRMRVCECQSESVDPLWSCVIKVRV